MSQRTERVDELLRQEIGTILAREAKDPRIGFATITDVETTPDLRHARVWVSVIGTPAERDAALIALDHAMHFVRRELGLRLRLRRIPELHVRLDDSIERGSRVLHVLRGLEDGRLPDEVEALDTLPTPVRRLHREGDADEPTVTGPEPARGPDAEDTPDTGRPPGPRRTSRTRSHPRPRAGLGR